jgi:sec-independent protein translocase protein TatA
MHFPAPFAIVIVLILAFLLFGKPGRLSSMMEDFGKGIRGFRKGMSDPQQPPAEPPKQVSDDSSANTGATQSNGDRASN